MDDLGQQDGIDSKTGSARLIKERIPKIDFFDFTENLNNLEVGSCWFDPNQDVFDRPLIHSDNISNYLRFTSSDITI